MRTWCQTYPSTTENLNFSELHQTQGRHQSYWKQQTTAAILWSQGPPLVTMQIFWTPTDRSTCASTSWTLWAFVTIFSHLLKWFHFYFQFISFSPLEIHSTRVSQLSSASGQPSHTSVNSFLSPLCKGVQIFLHPHSPLYLPLGHSYNDSVQFLRAYCVTVSPSQVNPQQAPKGQG